MPVRPEFSGGKAEVKMRPYDGRSFAVRYRLPIRLALSITFALVGMRVWPIVTADARRALAGPHHVPTSTYLVYDADGRTHLLQRPGARITPSGIDLMTSIEYGVSGDPSRPLPLSDVARLIRLCTPTMYQKDEMCQRAAISAPTDIMQSNISLVRSALIARLPSAYWYARQDAVRSYLLEECASHWWAHLDDFECRSAEIGARFVEASTTQSEALSYTPAPTATP